MKTKFSSENDHLNQTIIQWGQKQLLSLGYDLKNTLPENVRNTPWSYLVRFITSDGFIYLKHTPVLFALEPQIIQILQVQFNAYVPTVIAQNTELNCFLMKDAGRSLREILKEKFDVALICSAIEQFTLLQIATADRVKIFLEMGVPDYRLDKLPDLYKALISQKDLLLAEGLSGAEINKLEGLLATVSNLCKKLSKYAVKQTIVQSDFNDNNTLLDEHSQNITHIDLGEIVISHPFFSLLNFLQQMRKHHGLTEEDNRYWKIQNACFKNYMVFFESTEHLLEAIETAKLLYIVYGLADYYRFIIACGKENLQSFDYWKLGRLLKEVGNALSPC